MRRYFLVTATLLLLLGGCYSKPVRHLASDASLVKAGQSTRAEVLQYLGEPSGRRTVGDGVEEFVYYEGKQNFLRRSPVIGSMMDDEGYEILIITLTGDLVTNAEFRTFSKGEMDRFEGFTWDEVE